MVGLFLAPCLGIRLFFRLDLTPCQEVDLATLIGAATPKTCSNATNVAVIHMSSQAAAFR